jgi:hypothetical protein
MNVVVAAGHHCPNQTQPRPAAIRIAPAPHVLTAASNQQAHRHDEEIVFDRPIVPAHWEYGTVHHIVHRIERSLGAMMQVRPELKPDQMSLALMA